MNCDVVIPVRGRLSGKTRLSPCLGEDKRAALVEAMLSDVAAAVRASGAARSLSVASDCPGIARIARARGMRTVPGTGPGDLNGALAAALAALPVDGVRMVVMGDVPLARPDEIATLFLVARTPGTVAVARSADGGTSALALGPLAVLRPSFGADSASRHAAGSSTVVFDLPGLALDIDRPDDLSRLPAGRGESGALVRRWNAEGRGP